MTNPVVVLDGEEIELACTLDAAIKLSSLISQNPAAGSGPRGLGFRAYNGDLEAIAIAVSLFCKRPLADILRAVYEEGSGSFAIPVSEFYLRLANGGKPLTESEVSDESSNPRKGRK